MGNQPPAIFNYETLDDFDSLFDDKPISSPLFADRRRDRHHAE